MLIKPEFIEKAKAKLGDEMALIIAKELGIEDFDERNLKCCCPFHHENHPSFIWNKKDGRFRCFGACGQSFDIIDCFMKKGMTYIEAVQKLFEYADITYAFGEHHATTQYQYRYPHEEELRPKDNVYRYLKKRKISEETTDYLDIREDAKGNCVFNYYDTNDTLTMVKYRPSHRVEKGQSKNWCQKDADTMPLLFNMNRINIDKPLLICSGELDCAAAVECGWANAVSIPLGDQNTQWVDKNFEWLEQFKEIIICPDNDESGMKYCKDIVPRLGTWRCKVVNLPTKYKDLNEVLYYTDKEQTLKLIIEAKDTPVDSVSDFSEIKNIDLHEIDGVLTGFEELDRKLMKLFFGTLTIVTGINGSGKSSFISQVVSNAIDNGKNTFLYSGELPNFQTKNWINYVLAGQRNVEKFVGTAESYYKVRQDAQSQINDYYKGRLYIYKDGYDHKASSLLKAMEDCTRRYGTKLIIIDNLTSVNLESNENNKYQKQEEFVVNLLDFAKKFQVQIMLVVHPHKIETMRRLTKMDIQGISAIIDLAHRIISLYRVSEKDHQGIQKYGKNGGWAQEPIPYDVLCDVLKDRMLGYEGSTVGLYYDRPSRRFFTNEDDLDHRYRWDKKDYNGSPLPYGAPQLEAEDEIFGYTA